MFVRDIRKKCAVRSEVTYMSFSAIPFLRGLCVCYWFALDTALGRGTFDSISTPFSCAVLFRILWNSDLVSLGIIFSGKSSVCWHKSLCVLIARLYAPLLRQILQICSDYSLVCNPQLPHLHGHF